MLPGVGGRARWQVRWTHSSSEHPHLRLPASQRTQSPKGFHTSRSHPRFVSIGILKAYEAMDPLFVVDARHHGKGPVIFSWHPQGTLLATSGSNRLVHIFTCHGQLLHTIKSLPSTRCVHGVAVHLIHVVKYTCVGKKVVHTT